MTPEERAYDVVRHWANGKPWQLSDITDAIRAAEDAMRERCAQVAYDYEAAIKAAPPGQENPYWYAIAGAVRFVGDSIRETAASE